MLPALSFLADKVCIFVAKLKLSGKIPSGGTARDRQAKLAALCSASRAVRVKYGRCRELVEY